MSDIPVAVALSDTFSIRHLVTVSGIIEEAVSGKEGHLGIIGDMCNTASEAELSDTVFAVSCEDFGFLHELDSIAERVTGCGLNATLSTQNYRLQGSRGMY